MSVPTIVVAHGDPIQRAAISKLMAENGFNVVTLSNGREVLKHVLVGDVDLIIASVNMDEVDGIELLRALKAEPASPPVIIVATADGTMESIYLRIASLLGAVKTYELPVLSGILLGTVKGILLKQ